MKKHFMIDIETTGVVRGKDKVLQVALVEIDFDGCYWIPTGRNFERTLHYPGQPESEVAKEHMAALYKKCNEAPESLDTKVVGFEVRDFIHTMYKKEGKILRSQDKSIPDQVIKVDVPYIDTTPKFFMGWNASNFDMPFMFDSGMLTPSSYAMVNGKETLVGDAHYRIYEQTGALQCVSDQTGLSRDLVQKIAAELNPTEIKLPEGKEHDALYDCYKQIIMMNGLISLGRKGWRK